MIDSKTSKILETQTQLSKTRLDITQEYSTEFTAVDDIQLTFGTV